MRVIMRMAVLLGLAMVSTAHGHVNSARLQITVLVVNSPSIEVKSLDRAERIAGKIFAEAGLEVAWTDSADAADCRIQIVTVKPSGGDVTGFAVITPAWRDGDGYAAVVYPAVEAKAKSEDVDVAYILGATMAHEIGHLLLGASAHADRGVMSPRLGREQLRMVARGELLFTPEQAQRIRTWWWRMRKLAQ
jgi:hypothetical protein